MLVSESIIKSPSHDRQFLFEENEKIKKFLFSIQDEINNTYSEGPDMKKILNNHGMFVIVNTHISFMKTIFFQCLSLDFICIFHKKVTIKNFCWKRKWKISFKIISSNSIM